MTMQGHLGWIGCTFCAHGIDVHTIVCRLVWSHTGATHLQKLNKINIYIYKCWVGS